MSDTAKQDKVLKKVRALLALADEAGGATEHEREMARTQAYKLMAKHSIDETLARMTAEQKITPADERIEVYAPWAKEKALLAHVIYQAFGCKVVQLHKYDAPDKDTLVLDTFGFEADLVMSWTLFMHVIDPIFNSVYDDDVSWMTTVQKRSYLRGMSIQVADRIKEFYREELEQSDYDGTTALALRNKVAVVDEYMRDKYPELVPGKASKNHDPFAAGLGAAAGNNVDIALHDHKVSPEFAGHLG